MKVSIGESVDGSHAQTATLAFRMSALYERAKKVNEQAQEAIAKAVHAVEGAMATVRDRGPVDYEDDRDIRALIYHAARAGAQIGGGGGVGGVNTSKYGWLINAAILVSLALSAWTLKTVQQNTTDIAVMRCQLSPGTCPQVVRNGN